MMFTVAGYDDAACISWDCPVFWRCDGVIRCCVKPSPGRNNTSIYIPDNDPSTDRSPTC